MRRVLLKVSRSVHALTPRAGSLLLAGAALTGLAAEPAATPADSKITHVTVYADRARVSRSATVRIGKGLSVHAFGKLPGWTDEGSLRLSVEPTSAGRIVDVQVKRSYLARPDDEELRKATDAVLEISDRTAALDDELSILAQQARQVESIRAFSLEKLPKDAALRDINVVRYGEVVDFVAETLRKTASARRAAETSRRNLAPELAARQRTLNELKQRTQLEETTVLVSLQSETDGEAELRLTYMLPGATWEAAHELRAEGRDPEKIELATSAVVTQTTGEDWSGVDVSFSTQSPTDTIRIPELDALLIGGSRFVARVIGGKTESFAKAQRKYEGQNVYWYNHLNPQESAQMLTDNTARQRGIQTRIASLFLELQKRGTTAHFAGIGQPTIRSDGRSVRVSLAANELAATAKLVAAPQASLNAARTLELVNTGGLPLLPGQVALYHDGAFVGMTGIDFVAEGEAFAVFLGVADEIKLTRVLDLRHSSLVRGRRTRMEVAFEILLENLSDTAMSISLADRIPISEDKDVQIDKVRIDPGVEPDSNGLLRWDVPLEAKAKRAFRIEYRLEYPPEILERKNRQAEGLPSDDISLQIESLEAKFH